MAFLLVFVAAISTAPPFDEQASPSVDPSSTATSDVDCGLRSLFLLLRSQKIDVTFDEIRRRLPVGNPVGYSIGELRETARSLGFPLNAVRMDLRRRGLESPTIAYLERPDEGHFVFIRPVGVTGRSIQVLEYPFVPKIMDLDDFASRSGWQGIAIVPAAPWNPRDAGILVFTSFACLGVLLWKFKKIMT